MDRFQQLWRAELLHIAWTGLAEQSNASGDPYFDILRLKTDEPTRTAEWLAAELSRRHNRTVTAVAARQILHRAREKFAAHLRVAVAASITTHDAAEVNAELAELGLLVYCQPLE
jgi:hypothetical protein